MGRKPITEEEFKNRIKCMFGGKYTLVSEFVNIKTKVTLNCPEHGIFSIIPRNMLYKNEECKLCGIEKMAKTKALSKQEFVDKANTIHHNKYDYSFVNYLNGQSKIMIVCKQCGNIFEQRANNHLSGSGCPNCN